MSAAAEAAPAVELDDFRPADAPRVVSWIRDDDELRQVSPETPPPLTSDGVIGWGGPFRRQFLFRRADHPWPIGYAELNDMPGRPEQKWIGHFVLDPAWRGRAIGPACVRRLTARAFDERAVSEVILVVLPNNVRAVRCYLKAGLTQRGEEWKREPWSSGPYRMVRMGIERAGFERIISGLVR